MVVRPLVGRTRDKCCVAPHKGAASHARKGLNYMPCCQPESFNGLLTLSLVRGKGTTVKLLDAQGGLEDEVVSLESEDGDVEGETPLAGAETTGGAGEELHRGDLRDGRPLAET